MGYPHWTSKQIRALLDASNQGYSNNEIAEQLADLRPGVTSNQVASKRAKMGWGTRTKYKRLAPPAAVNKPMSVSVEGGGLSIVKKVSNETALAIADLLLRE